MGERIKENKRKLPFPQNKKEIQKKVANEGE